MPRVLVPAAALFLPVFIHGCALTGVPSAGVRSGLPAVWLGGPMAQPHLRTPAADIGLQDPPPGKSILYLLRAPDDRMDIAVFVNGKKFAELPEGAYTAIALPPGRHLVTTRAFSWLDGGLEIAPQAEINVHEDERRFFSIAGAAASQTPTPAAAADMKARTHRWKEVAEADAQGLMSMARVVLPEEDAL